MLNSKYKISKCSYIDGEKIIYTDKGQFLIKEKNSNKKELFNYLLSRKFNNFLSFEENDRYEIYPYKKDNINIDDKAIDLVYVISMLHNKTTIYKEIDIGKIKEVYENINNEIDDLYKYYYDMQDYIESKIYMSPAEYLLIRNISMIYNILKESKIRIDKWYSIKKKQTKDRLVQLHNDISIKNFIDNEELLLKNWDKSKRDWVIYDFYNFYRNDYKELEFSSLFEIYQTKYKYNKDEQLLFEALIFKIWKIKLDSSNYNNCIRVNDLIVYINKTNKFLLNNNHKQEKTDKNEFKNQNNNIESSSYE